MTMKLVVGLDGSEGAQRALAFALVEAAARGDSVVLASVVPYSPYSFPIVEDLAMNQRIRDDQRQRVEQDIIAPALAKAAEAGVAARPVVEFGTPTEVITDLAREPDVRAVIIGRRGLSTLKALVYGSVASSVVQVSPVPVVVVP